MQPIYADITPKNLELAAGLIRTFQEHLGKRKGDLLDVVSQFEERGFDYRLVRGLSTLLERTALFQVEGSIHPILARQLVFEEVGRRGPICNDDMRTKILLEAATKLGVTAKEVEESLYADLDHELVMKRFEPIDAVELLKRYNLSLTQTVLFRSTHMEARIAGNWKRVLRRLKFLGLMYFAEMKNNTFHVTMDGPLSLFKLTQRYGTRIAKLLPTIVSAEDWEITARVIRSGISGRRIFQLKLNSDEVGDKIRPSRLHVEEDEKIFDSLVEERFAERFQALRSGWKLTREPNPLIAGTHVLIPDFCFEKAGMKIYMEIVGFWTKKYLELKIQKLKELHRTDIIVAVDKQLACGKLKRAEGEVIFYKNNVPLKPILKYLKAREEAVVRKQVETLDLAALHLKGEVVELHHVAKELGILGEALKRKLNDSEVEGYRLIGDLLVSEEKLQEIESKIASSAQLKLSDAIQMIEKEGLGRPYEILEALEYGIEWHGLDVDRSFVYKK